jgi:hypothetical protein
MLTSRSAGGGGKMQIKGFSTAPGFDYVDGHKGAWRRQIAFAKDEDPSGPTYFLLRDTHSAGDAATWRLWLAAKLPGQGSTKPRLPQPGAKAGDDDGLELEEPGKAKPAKQSHGVTVAAHGATVDGLDDVDLDIFVYRAPTLSLRTEKASQTVSCGYRNGRTGRLTNTRIALSATLEGRGAIAALLYPRLKTEEPPEVTWLADGRVAKVQSAAGTDYVFADSDNSTREYAVDRNRVSFKGAAGAVRIRGRRATLTLGAAGSIRYGRHTLTGDAGETRTLGR